VGAGLLALLCLGVLFATLVLLLSATIAAQVNREAVTLAELSGAIRIAALAVPLVVVTAGVNACLEAFSRFGYSNIVRIIVAAGTIGGATAWSYYSTSLPDMAAVLVLSRFVALGAAAEFLWGQLKAHRETWAIRLRDIAQFVLFARWITAANLLSPFLAYGDRLALSVLVSAGSLSYYLVPHDIVTRTLILPSAILGSLLPVLASTRDRVGQVRLLKNGGLGIAVLMVPLTLVLAVAAEPALGWWISEDFAKNSAPIARLLCLGVAFNSLATLPFAFLQARGYSKSVAIVQLIETPVYVSAMAWLAARYGVVGVAATWAVRLAGDCLLLWFVTFWKLHQTAARHA
jgi:O-antigen/teichoic acid export membrane protein